jgi:hypothetical protein
MGGSAHQLSFLHARLSGHQYVGGAVWIGRLPARRRRNKGSQVEYVAAGSLDSTDVQHYGAGRDGTHRADWNDDPALPQRWSMLHGAAVIDASGEVPTSHERRHTAVALTNDHPLNPAQT